MLDVLQKQDLTDVATTVLENTQRFGRLKNYLFYQVP